LDDVAPWKMVENPSESVLKLEEVWKKGYRFVRCLGKICHSSICLPLLVCFYISLKSTNHCLILWTDDTTGSRFMIIHPRKINQILHD